MGTGVLDGMMGEARDLLGLTESETQCCGL